VGALAGSLLTTILGLVQKENWAKNPWLIPVIVALAWGVFQETY
jgi:hypothetical protein